MKGIYTVAFEPYHVKQLNVMYSTVQYCTFWEIFPERHLVVSYV